jgi:hypothetical protein
MCIEASSSGAKIALTICQGSRFTQQPCEVDALFNEASQRKLLQQVLLLSISSNLPSSMSCEDSSIDALPFTSHFADFCCLVFQFRRSKLQKRDRGANMYQLLRDAMLCMIMSMLFGFTRAQGTWSTAQLSVSRYLFAAASVDDMAIFAGGFTPAGVQILKLLRLTLWIFTISQPVAGRQPY